MRMKLKLKDYPELLKQWDNKQNPIDSKEAENLGHQSKKKVWWICPTDSTHRWQAPVYVRTNGHQCPYCMNQLASPGNNLLIKFPEIAAEWNYERNLPEKPEDFLSGSHRKKWWKCKTCKWEWQAVIKDRTGGNGCSNCSGKIITPANNLLIKFPEVANEWHYELNLTNPSEFASKANTKVWWQCKACKIN